MANSHLTRPNFAAGRILVRNECEIVAVGITGGQGRIHRRWPGTRNGSARTTSSSTPTATPARPTHVDFVEARLGGGRPRAVLDLACGAGRHTEALRRRGYRALGVDLSLTLLARPARAPRVAGDMRAPALRRRILRLGAQLLHLLRLLRERARELPGTRGDRPASCAPGGRFLIDFLNRERVLAELEPREVQEIDGPPGRDRALVRCREPAHQQADPYRGPGPLAARYLESVRAYGHDEVTIGLRWAGLEVDDALRQLPRRTLRS